MNTSVVTTPEPLVDLQQLVTGIRWRRRLWVSTGVLGLLAGAALTLLVPPTPTATARVLIVHVDDSTDRQDLMATDVAVLQSTRVAALALQRISKTERPEVFVGHYSGKGLSGNVLELTVTGSSNPDALQRAQALSETFIADHIQRTEADANRETQDLKDSLTRAEHELAQLNPSGGPPGATVDDRREELNTQIDELRRRIGQSAIGIPRVAAGTQIVDAAHKTTASRLMTALLEVGLGLLLGLGGGLAYAALASVVQDRPVLRRDIAAHLGASVVAQIPCSPSGLARVWRRGRAGPGEERKRVASTLARIVRGYPTPVSLLGLGCSRTAAELTRDVAERLAADQPMVVIDGLPGRDLQRLTGTGESSLRVLDAAEPGEPGERRDFQLGVGSVEPGTAWTDLAHLGMDTLLVVQAGRASAAWLHTVSRQLAEARIPVIGVVLVHPDPRDTSDGTLWDRLHALRAGQLPQRTRDQEPPAMARNGSGPSTTAGVEAL